MECHEYLTEQNVASHDGCQMSIQLSINLFSHVSLLFYTSMCVYRRHRFVRTFFVMPVYWCARERL